MKPRRPCIEQGCYEQAIHKSRCKDHQPPAWIGSDRKERLPKDWKQRRKMVFKRLGTWCHVCKQEGATQIDHIVAGDDHSFSNLAPIHYECHKKKTIAERPLKGEVERDEQKIKEAQAARRKHKAPFSPPVPDGFK